MLTDDAGNIGGNIGEYWGRRDHFLISPSPSQAQLAEKLGWKASRVSRVLNGSTNLTIKTIHQICQAVDRDFDLVLRRTTQPQVTGVDV